MPLALKLSHDEPRLAYLALVYHLGRPGSELDPATRLPVENGLRRIKVELGNNLDAESAVIELDDWQYGRLASAMMGCVTELRVYHMREGALSTVQRWTETARTLFPALKADPEVALDLAESMMMFRRRIEHAVGRAADASEAQEPDVPAESTRRLRLFGRRKD